MFSYPGYLHRLAIGSLRVNNASSYKLISPLKAVAVFDYYLIPDMIEARLELDAYCYYYSSMQPVSFPVSLISMH